MMTSKESNPLKNYSLSDKIIKNLFHMLHYLLVIKHSSLNTLVLRTYAHVYLKRNVSLVFFSHPTSNLKRLN